MTSIPSAHISLETYKLESPQYKKAKLNTYKLILYSNFPIYSPENQDKRSTEIIGIIAELITQYLGCSYFIEQLKCSSIDEFKSLSYERDFTKNNTALILNPLFLRTIEDSQRVHDSLYSLRMSKDYLSENLSGGENANFMQAADDLASGFAQISKAYFSLDEENQDAFIEGLQTYYQDSRCEQVVQSIRLQEKFNKFEGLNSFRPVGLSYAPLHDHLRSLLELSSEALIAGFPEVGAKNENNLISIVINEDLGPQDTPFLKSELLYQFSKYAISGTLADFTKLTRYPNVFFDKVSPNNENFTYQILVKLRNYLSRFDNTNDLNLYRPEVKEAYRTLCLQSAIQDNKCIAVVERIWALENLWVTNPMDSSLPTQIQYLIEIQLPRTSSFYEKLIRMNYAASHVAACLLDKSDSNKTTKLAWIDILSSLIMKGNNLYRCIDLFSFSMLHLSEIIIPESVENRIKMAITMFKGDSKASYALNLLLKTIRSRLKKEPVTATSSKSSTEKRELEPIEEQANSVAKENHSPSSEVTKIFQLTETTSKEELPPQTQDTNSSVTSALKRKIESS